MKLRKLSQKLEKIPDLQIRFEPPKQSWRKLKSYWCRCAVSMTMNASGGKLRDHMSTSNGVLRVSAWLIIVLLLSHE